VYANRVLFQPIGPSHRKKYAHSIHQLYKKNPWIASKILGQRFIKSGLFTMSLITRLPETHRVLLEALK